MHRLLRPLMAAIALAGSAAVAAAQDAPVVHLPPGTAKDAVLPVLVVEGGVVAQSGLPESLWKELPAVVVETASVRTLLRDPDGSEKIEAAIEAALQAAQKKHDIAAAPWAVCAFSAAASQFAHVVWRSAGRFQGLALVNARLTQAQLVHAALSRRGLPTLVLNGTQDPVAPQAAGEALRDLCNRCGLRVTFQTVDTAEHFAPLGTAGAPALAAWLKSLPAKVEARPEPPATITTKTEDGVALTGDLYDTGDKSKPVVCLFHQARSSRGEYRPVGPKLRAAGFNCLAIDQRSGQGFNGIRNRTAAAAIAAGKATQPRTQPEALQSYLSARPDLHTAIAWVRKLGYTGKLAIVGSSYSSSHAIFVAADNSEVAAVVSCSPGDYLPPRGSILEAGRRLQKPALVICPPNEERQARQVFEPIAAAAKELYVQPEGAHGASTFYTSPTADEAWARLLKFLRSHTAG